MDKLLILLVDRRMLALRAFRQKMKGVLTQLIELIVFKIIKIRRFKPLQAAVRRQGNPLIWR